MESIDQKVFHLNKRADIIENYIGPFKVLKKNNYITD